MSLEWSKSLYSVFPNNAVTNPSVKNKDKKLLESLEKLIGQVESLEKSEKSGNCISCGKYNVEQTRTKTEIPLIGSGTLINFFPYGQQGADYCPVCTLAVQFSPLVFYACGKLLLIHSNSNKVMSATLPSFLKEMFKQDLGIETEISFTELELDEFTRHRVSVLKGGILDNLDLIRKELDHKKKVLVVCNTVAQAQKIYNLLSQGIENSGLIHGLEQRGLDAVRHGHPAREHQASQGLRNHRAGHQSPCRRRIPRQSRFACTRRFPFY